MITIITNAEQALINSVYRTYQAISRHTLDPGADRCFDSLSCKHKHMLTCVTIETM